MVYMMNGLNAVPSLEIPRILIYLMLRWWQACSYELMYRGTTPLLNDLDFEKIPSPAPWFLNIQEYYNDEILYLACSYESVLITRI